MNLGSHFLALSMTLCLLGCAESSTKTYLQYPEAKEMFEVGMSYAEVEELYGTPVDIMEYKTMVSWYYDPNEVIEKLEPGGRWEAFKVNFQDDKAIGIQPILITSR